MNLAGVPSVLRSWAISLNNRMTQAQNQINQLSQQAASTLTRVQRPVVDHRPGRITAAYPPPTLPEGDNAYFYPVTSGPIVQVNSVSGLIKISLDTTIIIRPLSVVGGISGRYDLGMGFSIVGSPTQEVDRMAIRSGDFSNWAIQENNLGTSVAPAVVNREYKFRISATQYATIPVGQHYIRAEYYLAGEGNSAQVSFANRTLVVEAI